MEAEKDAVGNVVIRKAATPGMENKKAPNLTGPGLKPKNATGRMTSPWRSYLLLYIYSSAVERQWTVPIAAAAEERCLLMLYPRVLVL